MNSHRTVESFRIDSVKDQSLPSQIDGLPFNSEQLQELLQNCPAILIDPACDRDSLPFSPSEPTSALGYQLKQPSPDHRRSFELVPTEQGKTWTDEYGNTYSALTLKGNNFSNPSIVEHPTASEGFIAYGLQESSIIERVLRASKLLRSRNISTEHTIGLAEPKQYPWPLIDSMTDAYESIPLKEYKRRIITNYWSELPDEERTPVALAELYKKFDDMTFYVSLRATDTAFRLFDMDAVAARQATYDQINQQQLLPEGSEPLDASNPGDIDRYLEHVFSPRVGRNYARLHVDLTHRFAHGLNMSALGSIVDLDSIHGSPLGFDDKEVTDADRATDIADVMTAILRMQHSREVNNSIHFIDSYINETISLHPTIESAVDHLSGVFNALFEQVQSRQRLGEIRNGEVVFSYVNDYFYQIVEERLTQEELDDLTKQSKLYVYEAIASPDIDAVICEQFTANAQSYADELIEEHATEIASAVYNGEQFDMFEAIRRAYNQPASYVGKLMIDHILACYYTEIQKRINASEQRQQPTTSDQATLRTIAHDVILRKTLREYNEELRSIAAAKVAELIPTLEAPLAAAINYTVADSIIEEYGSFANMGLNESHLWLCTDQVPLPAAITAIEASDLPITIEELALKDSPHDSIDIPSFTPDVVIDEIISDSLFDGWTHHDAIAQPVLNIHLDRKPTYILIRETVNQDTSRLRLQLPDETYQLIISGRLTLRDLLPTYEQPTLF